MAIAFCNESDPVSASSCIVLPVRADAVTASPLRTHPDGRRTRNGYYSRKGAPEGCRAWIDGVCGSSSRSTERQRTGTSIAAACTTFPSRLPEPPAGMRPASGCAFRPVRLGPCRFGLGWLPVARHSMQVVFRCPVPAGPVAGRAHAFRGVKGTGIRERDPGGRMSFSDPVALHQATAPLKRVDRIVFAGWCSTRSPARCFGMCIERHA